ncbi:hypothetical protein Leryth_021110 [Lithospermum erythrorhizon]|nr:hypothetical protein Leryth_021110 [Lithospermum erythrorhizon]
MDIIVEEEETIYFLQETTDIIEENNLYQTGSSVNVHSVGPRGLVVVQWVGDGVVEPSGACIIQERDT